MGPRVPQTRNRLLRRFGQSWFEQMGWKFKGEWPDIPKFVLIVAPHSSNWDFVAGLAAKWALGLQVRWLGKHTLFIPPLGWFMRAIGGVPVERSARHNVVSQSAHEFSVRDRFVLVITPEGTRKNVGSWRSGFWHVAKLANVPICPVAFDWGTRTMFIGPTTMPFEDDPDVGIARVRSYYAGVRGFDQITETAWSTQF